MAVKSQKIDYQIVHAIAGRIRLKIPRLQRDSSYADRLQQLVASNRNVTGVRVNSANGSLVVNYNRNVDKKVIQAQIADCIQKAKGIKTAAASSPDSFRKPVAETIDKDDANRQAVSPTTEQSKEPVAETIDKDDANRQAVSPTMEQSKEPVAETIENDHEKREEVSPAAEKAKEYVAEESLAEIIENNDENREQIYPAENENFEGIEKSIATQLSQANQSEVEQFPTNIHLEKKLFEVGIPASYILPPLNAELDKFEAENEKNTESQRIKLNLDASLKEGGFFINGQANGKFREPWMINPFTGKKYYTPWVSITAVGTAELEATVVDETLNVNLTKLNVYGASGKWYKRLVKYAFEYLFRNKLAAKINETLSEIDGAKIQQIFFRIKEDKKLQESAQKLGLTAEKIDQLLELVEVNARVTPEYVWLYVQL